MTHNTLDPVHIFTALFLHANLLHLVGNMLFLWIFGSSLEGRIRPLRFLILYFAAGYVGTILEDLVSGMINPDQPCVGASGAIMGLAGAYLYVFPFALIRAFYLLWFFLYIRVGITVWQAQWVILLYVGLDLWEGFLFQGADGVGHFAHLGGAATGLLGVVLFKVRRDSEERSEAQAQAADVGGDPSMLSFFQLEALMEHPTDNVNLVMEYLKRAKAKSDISYMGDCLLAIQNHERLLLEKADPKELARIALFIPITSGTLSPPFYLLLGSRVETFGAYDVAARLYQRVYEIDTHSADAEMALYRMAHLLEHRVKDLQKAAGAYSEMLRAFPDGEMAFHARDALRRFAQPVR